MDTTSKMTALLDHYIYNKNWPDPTGLLLGIGAVFVGHIITLSFHYWRISIKSIPLQIKERNTGQPPIKNFFGELYAHFLRVESFVTLIMFLSVCWMFKLLPASYYSFVGGISWLHVLYQFLVVDFMTYLMHFLEHTFATVYKFSHKPHHRYTSPHLFNAFDGSIPDTIIMILIPLFITSQVVHCNVWSYMTFGTLYANYFMLIHSEYEQIWDPLFQRVGICTAADHHVHHTLFIYNYGHFFTYWDRLFGTFKSPATVRQLAVRKPVNLIWNFNNATESKLTK